MALLINRSRPNKTAKNGNTGLNFVNDGVLTHCLQLQIIQNQKTIKPDRTRKSCSVNGFFAFRPYFSEGFETLMEYYSDVTTVKPLNVITLV